ncbi:MAG: 3-keto-5-aminohexanoate cleavage protein [Devosiaceae bacterium]|nr:3-keto-5-aminohexanoate cleavage protein [Devosiaceae bacterium]
MSDKKTFIMVAPNGARKNKKDHLELPIILDEIVASAVACYKAGAGAIHAHVRDKQGKHTLDAGLYSELIDELAKIAPKMVVQITTEAVGQYSPSEQRELVRQVKPSAVSVALREMMSDGDTRAQREFYWQASDEGIDLQHIIYSSDEILLLSDLISKNIVPLEKLSMLFVLGRYSKNQTSIPDDLLPFLSALEQSGLKEQSKIMGCAFGQNELNCLLALAKAGSDCRIGFENNHFLPDGRLARDNATQVKMLVATLAESCR